QLTLATMYATGLGVAVDPAQAARWFRAALDTGEQAAEVPYATLLATGSGVERDDAAARALFEHAAQRGDAGAQWSLGLFRDEGPGESAAARPPARGARARAPGRPRSCGTAGGRLSAARSAGRTRPPPADPWGAGCWRGGREWRPSSSLPSAHEPPFTLMFFR